ncbi:MAG: TlpA disulfide reductase family protein [Mucinivorans sp.]
MKKIILVFGFLWMIVSPLLANELLPQRTVVAGRVMGLTEGDQRVMTVNFCDPLSENDKIAVRMGADGSFVAEYPMYFDQNITIAYGGKFVNVFLAPADSIFVTFDMSKFRGGDLSGVTFSGSKARHNNLFAPFVDFLYSLPPAKLDLSLEPSAMVAQIQKAVCRTMDTVKIYSENHHLTPQIVSWARRDVIYQIANGIVDYKQDSASMRLALFTDKIFDIENEANFQTMLFAYHLNSVMMAMLSSDEQILTQAKNQNIDQYVSRALAVICTLPRCTVRDVIIYQFLDNVLGEMPEQYAKVSPDMFANKLVYNRLKAMVDVKKADVTIKNDIVAGGVNFLSSGLDTAYKTEVIDAPSLINYLASKHKGKVLYIDVFATWCGPCRAEFPFAKKLEALYENNSDVVFVNLCLASESDKWITTVLQNSIQGENYLLNSDATNIFMSTYSLSGYPSYMIVDGEGRLVTNKAPRPSDISQASGEIDKLIKR